MSASTGTSGRCPVETLTNTIESEVRDYCRLWPTTFDTARHSYLYDTSGRQYIDFFAGAGSLNYGHNPPVLKPYLLDYIERDGLIHGLDVYTTAKQRFLDLFRRLILEPRSLPYRVQFPGPTGTNANEAALKLARKLTGRQSVVTFTNAFHGMTLGSLSVTGNRQKRQSAGIPLVHATPVPYDKYLDDEASHLASLERLLSDPGSGIDRPAAAIVECVQGEGGVNVARVAWLRALADLCDRRGILLIVDDVQMGCGRTGSFFSFEAAGIIPDIVTLGKSISGYGLPLALTLVRQDLDIWEPGEHSGTFRSNNAALTTGAAALEHFWASDELQSRVRVAGDKVAARLMMIADSNPELALTVRGRGLINGLSGPPGLAKQVCEAAFDRGLLIETSGPNRDVVKVMPALTVRDDDLDQGLDILATALTSVWEATRNHVPATDY